MAMTKSTAQTHLDAWLAADTAVSLGESVSVGDRQLSRVNASEVKQMIAYWQRVVDTFNAREQNSDTDGSFKVATF